MKAQQDVFRVRRKYNQWVANQTLEDYALRFTAKAARRWSAARVSQTALGAISFLALEAIGGAITLSYGFDNAVAAIMVVGAIIFLTGIPISYHAAMQGVDIDLLTRGAGFGYIGSTVTSLIYASFTFIFFALEAAILALALELTLDIPLSIGYVISALMVIPLVTHGITLISRFQVWTQPIWIILQVIPLVCIAWQSEHMFEVWSNFESIGGTGADPLIHQSGASGASGLNLIAFGAASAVIFSLIAQIGEQVDFLRFLPAQEKPNGRWWFAMMAAGPGWIVAGVIKILIGSFLAVLALHHGVSPEDASDPNRMYLTAFSYISNSPELSLFLLGVFVVISQLKINVTNAYAGSIAWSNFFSRVTHNHPGRVVWLVFNVVIALLLMELGIYQVLEEILGSYAIVALAWVGTIVADLVINRPLGLRPQTMEFKRAHLYDINPVGVGSMTIASILGFVCHVGWLGPELKALSSFVALGSTFVCAPLLAWWTKGKYYIAREPVIFETTSPIECCICSHSFEPEDMTLCPAYAGNICSLCCSLDGRCQDMCKTDSRFADQLVSALSVLLPTRWVKLLNTQIGHFLGLFMLTSLVIASVLLLVFFQIASGGQVAEAALAHALTNVFFILLIIFGVVSWMFTLAHDSRVIAQKESEDQTKLLRTEIRAHKETDEALQKAKELAESANLAKSRYLTGISHELRSPLNAIMGYAQLLEKDPNIPEQRRDALSIIRRSGEHLADLIEGLLDISRIEAGRLNLDRSDVHLNSLLDQLVSMFRVQAEDKGVTLIYDKQTLVPDVVRADPKRLRQVLINLLSNAIKYTHKGSVRFSVSYRNQVAVFRIVDTGVGIDEEELETIFKPFERILKPGQPHVSGTGLGLTITSLLVDIMGGDIQVQSTLNEGSTFTLSLMLSSVMPVAEDHIEDDICGYHGATLNAFIVDDDPDHRAIMSGMLSPLGFNIVTAQDPKECLSMLEHCQFTPNIFLLDVSMPGMSGWELARIIRTQLPEAFILMASANANVQPPFAKDPSDGYIVKPIRMRELLEKLGHSPLLSWRYAGEAPISAPPALGYSDAVIAAQPAQLSAEVRQELIRLAQIGYVNAIREKLNTIRQLSGGDASHLKELNELYTLANSFQFAELIERLEHAL
jgi:signal transduction histidine kinase/CheY-like chemotaxis protein